MARNATIVAVLSTLVASFTLRGCGGANHGNDPHCLQEQELLFGAEPLRAQHEYVCCNNEKWAEPSGSMSRTSLFADVQDTTTFYDAACGVPLFKLGARPREEWEQESRAHGWPSFRDNEVVELGTNVLEKAGGEIVSSCGTHLGHNLPDSKGNRYCINLLCIAGHPAQVMAVMTTAEAPAPPTGDVTPPAA
jgi:peptide methionine sulfoxide reductase MsrB